MQPMVVIHVDENGGFDPFFCGDVRVLVIDERAPHDRVYEMTKQSTVETMQKLIGITEIGSANDSRYAALKNRIEKAIEGKPHLIAIEDQP